jgi:hypothetical protein
VVRTQRFISTADLLRTQQGEVSVLIFVRNQDVQTSGMNVYLTLNAEMTKYAVLMAAL